MPGVMRAGFLTIQAGSEGLKGAFYEELINSAKETFGYEKVQINSINRTHSYLFQTLRTIRYQKCKYILLDPRTLHSNAVFGIVQAFISSLIISKNSIKPIVFLTDASVVKWRLMSIIWTASDGICLMLMKPEKLKNLFPHARSYGPIFVPISEKRRNELSTFIGSDKKELRFGFQGSLYPERQNYLDEIEKCCSELKVHFCIHEKNQGAGNESYWKFISDHDVIVTTTLQTNLDNNLVDNINENQMVFRISEVIASGKILMTTPVEGIEKFFIADKDFIEIENIDAVMESCKLAITKISDSKESVGGQAKEKYEKLIENKCFWRLAGIQEVGECQRDKCACLV